MTAQLISPTAGKTDETLVDEKGDFRFDRLSPGIYDLYLNVNIDPTEMFSNMQSTRIEVLAGETTFVEFSLDHPVELSGRVYRENDPVPGALVSFQFYNPRETRMFYTRLVADEDGHYEVRFPWAGIYSVLLRSKEDGLRDDASELVVEIAKEGNHRRDLHFSDGSIRGMVRDPEGSALEGVEAVLWIPSPEKTGSSKGLRMFPRITQSDGSFRYSALSPGEYRLEVRAGGFRSFFYGPFPIKEHQNYVVPDIVLENGSLEGAEIIAKVTLSPDPPIPIPAVSNQHGLAKVESPTNGSFFLFGVFPAYPPALFGPVEFTACPFGTDFAQVFSRWCTADSSPWKRWISTGPNPTDFDRRYRERGHQAL